MISSQKEKTRVMGSRLQTGHSISSEDGHREAERSAAIPALGFSIMEGPRQEKIKHDGRKYVLNAR